MKNKPTIAVNELAFFSGLAPTTIAALQAIACQYRLLPGESLFHQGDIAQALYVVVRGGVRLVEHTTEGKDVNLKVYGPEDVFGLMAVSGGFPYHAEVVAITTSEVIAFDGKQMRQVMQQSPDLSLRFIDALVDHVHHAHNRIRHFAVEKVRQRLARALLHFCAKFGEIELDDKVSANFSQKDIAEFTGATVETVNRLFREWEKDGYIQWQRMRIVILDINSLREIAEGTAEMGMGYLVE